MTISTVKPSATSRSAAVGARKPPSSSSTSADRAATRGTPPSSSTSTSIAGTGPGGAAVGRSSDPVATITASGRFGEHGLRRRRDADAQLGAGDLRLVVQPVDVARPALPAPPRAPARRARPPSCGRRSKRTTSWPRSAAPRAASSPATPPPTTTTRPGVAAGPASASCGSRMPGFTEHHIGRSVYRRPMQPSFSPMQGRAAPTDAGLRGQVGVGDDRARHRDEVDARSRTHASAMAGSTLRPATRTGTPTRLAEAPRALVVDALRELVAGHEVRGRQPRRAGAAAHAEQVDRPARREAARRRRSARRGRGRRSGTGRRAIRNADDEVVRTPRRARPSSTSRPKRVRFSRLPPYSSVRVLTRGVEELLDQVARRTTSPRTRPSRSAPDARAASAKRVTIAGISAAAQRRPAPRGGRPPGGRTGRAAGCRSASTCRAAPCASSATCSARRGRGRPRPARGVPARCARPTARSTPYDAAVAGSTDAEPNVMTSPQPPAALRTW